MKRNLIIMLLAVSLSLSACGSPSTPSSSENEKSSQSINGADSSNSSQTITIEDIDWTVDEGIVDGERYVTFDYTNNSKYTITSFIIEFSQRTDVGEDELEKCYSDLQDYFDYSDERLEEKKQEPLLMYAYSEKVVNPGETQTDLCYYDYGLTYLKNIDYYSIMQPDIATIKYIDDDMIYTVYYDFNSNKYSPDENPIKACQWSNSELANKVPKPEANIVEITSDLDSMFSFTIYGASFELFNSYVDACISLGYNIDADNYSGSSFATYSADDEDGYNMDLSYYGDSERMRCTVYSPD